MVKVSDFIPATDTVPGNHFHAFKKAITHNITALKCFLIHQIRLTSNKYLILQLSKRNAHQDQADYSRIVLGHADFPPLETVP